MTVDDIDETLAKPFGTYREILSGWACVQPEKLALRDGSGDLTWAQMWCRIERIAARLAATGLKRGQHVAILGTSTSNYALVFLAAVIAGAMWRRFWHR